jgi:hypothetical protein
MSSQLPGLGVYCHSNRFASLCAGAIRSIRCPRSSRETDEWRRSLARRPGSQPWLSPPADVCMKRELPGEPRNTPIPRPRPSARRPGTVISRTTGSDGRTTALVRTRPAIYLIRRTAARPIATNPAAGAKAGRKRKTCATRITSSRTFTRSKLGSPPALAASNPGGCVWTLTTTSGEPETERAKCSESVVIRNVPYRPGEAGDGGILVVRDESGKELVRDTIAVKDTLVVGLGDSFGSGEGNPDRPVRFAAPIPSITYSGSYPPVLRPGAPAPGGWPFRLTQPRSISRPKPATDSQDRRTRRPITTPARDGRAPTAIARNIPISSAPRSRWRLRIPTAR